MAPNPRYDRFGSGRTDSSYDAVDRARWQRRARRPGGGGAGGFDDGLRRVLTAFLAVFALVAVKLVWYQVIDARALAAEASSRRTIDTVLTPRRGTIFDRNGNVLAISEACKTIQCAPANVERPAEVAELLGEYLGESPDTYLRRLTVEGSFSYVEKQVDAVTADELEAELSARGLVGLDFVDDFRRSYPYEQLAGQVLGMVGTDGHGLNGLERYYDELLSGSEGSMRKEVSADGTPIAGGLVEVEEAQDGIDIVVSLDVDVQQVAEAAIVDAVREYKAESGSVVVTDPRSGEILAICSTPLLDPRDFENYTDEKALLKPVVSSYEPGSIFKVLTSAVGVDAGLLTDISTFTVPPTIKVGDDDVHDDDDRDYTMNMSLREILRRSSNVGMALVSQTLIGATTFASGIDNFGIGSRTGIDFDGESEGLVRALDEYDGSSLGSMSFGQGLAMPMIQMVKAIGAIANGGVMETPHFLIFRGGSDGDEVGWESAGRAVSEEAASAVTDMMRTVVEEGTAVEAQVDGYDVAGKTGTGEQADASGGYKKDSYVSSLIGFAPAYDPEVLVYVGLNGTPFLASGSAAPTFSTIMGEALMDMGVQPTY